MASIASMQRICAAHLVGARVDTLTDGTRPPQVEGSSQFLKPLCWNGQPLRFSCGCTARTETHAGQGQHSAEQPRMQPYGGVPWSTW